MKPHEAFVMFQVLWVTLLALVLLAGCAGQPSLSDELSKLDARVVIDLDAAQAIAVANNDELAMACYPVLKEWFVATFGTPTPTADQVKGVISAYEKARTVRRGAESGGLVLPNKLKLACAALLQDERLFALRLAALFGGAAIPGVGSIAPFLPK
jgi:hypothetical protein